MSRLPTADEPINNQDQYSLARQLVSEAIGTCLLVATVIGSGIMGDLLSSGNVAVALLANSVATGAILVVIILCFGPISGAHFNPAVTLAFFLKGDCRPKKAIAFCIVQVAGGILGAILAHLMFDLPAVQIGTHVRFGPGQWIGEFVATFALVFSILACVRFNPRAVPYAVGLVITAGYWYTSSTSFANPAVTISRTFTDTFASIRPVDAALFVPIEFVSGAVTVMFARWLLTYD